MDTFLEFLSCLDLISWIIYIKASVIYKRYLSTLVNPQYEREYSSHVDIVEVLQSKQIFYIQVV